MDRSEDAEDVLVYTFKEYPEATVNVVHVTATNDTFGLFDSRDPAEYVVTECNFELNDGLMPDGNAFNRHQRRRVEAVIKRACRLADEYDREIEPVVQSGNTVENVLACAEAKSVDHIVIGDHCHPSRETGDGHGPLDSAFLSGMYSMGAWPSPSPRDGDSSPSPLRTR